MTSPTAVQTGTTWRGASGIGKTTLPALHGIRPEQMLVADFGRPIGSFFGDRLSTADLNLSITQASTLTLGLIDPKRELINSPLLNQAVTIDVGSNPGRRFKLVQVSKTGDMIKATCEDALVNYLRTVKGQDASAPGVVSRVDFARQLLRPLKVPLIAPPKFTRPALEPLTRGTSNNPDEDTWACLVRIATDVGYRCFSDGTAIWFGPDDWLLNYGAVLTIAERTGGVDNIDFDYDIGKAVATAKVATYSGSWTTAPGGPVQVVNAAAASGRWLCSELSRNLFRVSTKASLVVAQPTLPEPDDSDTHTVTFQARN